MPVHSGKIRDITAGTYSAATLKKFVASHYRRTCDLLDRYNVDIHWLDCNGNIEKLIPFG